MDKKLIEKVSNVLKEANRALTVGAIVGRLVKAGDSFTKKPKHEEYVEMGHCNTILQSMKADVYTAIKCAEDADLHDIVIDRSVKPLTVFLKSDNVRNIESYVRIDFTDIDGGVRAALEAHNVSNVGMVKAIECLEGAIKQELDA